MHDHVHMLLIWGGGVSCCHPPLEAYSVDRHPMMGTLRSCKAPRARTARSTERTLPTWSGPRLAGITTARSGHPRVITERHAAVATAEAARSITVTPFTWSKPIAAGTRALAHLAFQSRTHAVSSRQRHRRCSFTWDSVKVPVHPTRRRWKRGRFARKSRCTGGIPCR